MSTFSNSKTRKAMSHSLNHEELENELEDEEEYLMEGEVLVTRRVLSA